MADAPIQQLFSEQNGILAEILSSNNPKTTSDLIAKLSSNIIKILERMYHVQGENHQMTVKRIDAVKEFFQADSERVSNKLDRMESQLRETAKAEKLEQIEAHLRATAKSEDMQAEFSAIRKQLAALLQLSQPR